MAVIGSVEELHDLTAERPEHARTYQVKPDARIEIRAAAESACARSGRPMRRMTEAEVGELADYLGAPASELQHDMKISAVTCTGCGRLLTMLDFAKSGVEAGFHSKPMVADVLSGRTGSWITIRGKDGGRPVCCADCGRDCPPLVWDYLCDGPDFHYVYY